MQKKVKPSLLFKPPAKGGGMEINMINKTFSIQFDGYEGEATVTTYFYDIASEILVKERPLILVCPGGAYAYRSARESESIAFQFNSFGYHAAVMNYSCAPATYPTQLFEIAACVKFLKDNHREYGIDPDRIIIFGASAGAHAAAMFATGYFNKEVIDVLKVKENYLKPAGMILAYPVITSGKFAHRGSFDNLLGKEKDNKELLKLTSIENRVDSHTPAAFIWHTFADGSVPVENSLLLADALKKENIPFELHIFPTGGHGLAMATEMTLSNSRKELDAGAAQWISLCKNWLERTIGPLC